MAGKVLPTHDRVADICTSDLISLLLLSLKTGSNWSVFSHSRSAARVWHTMQSLTLIMSADMEVEWMKYCEADMVMLIPHGGEGEGGRENPQLLSNSFEPSAVQPCSTSCVLLQAMKKRAPAAAFFYSDQSRI